MGVVVLEVLLQHYGEVSRPGDQKLVEAFVPQCAYEAFRDCVRSWCPDGGAERTVDPCQRGAWVASAQSFDAVFAGADIRRSPPSQSHRSGRMAALEPGKVSPVGAVVGGGVVGVKAADGLCDHCRPGQRPSFTRH
jgi:hypothetical protein